jgi:hypothetical protein
MVSDLKAIAAKTLETGICTRRIAARSRGMAAKSPFPLIST